MNNLASKLVSLHFFFSQKFISFGIRAFGGCILNNELICFKMCLLKRIIIKFLYFCDTFNSLLHCQINTPFALKYEKKFNIMVLLKTSSPEVSLIFVCFPNVVSLPDKHLPTSLPLKTVH